MTTMDSDSESQDSDDGRRFRFEATRKDNVHAESKFGKVSKSNSEQKFSYDDAEHKDRKERSKYEGRREHRSSKERDVDNKDPKHSTKYSKHSHESRSSRREDSKDYGNARDASVDSKSSASSSKRKTSDSKRHRNRDRSEHRKHRSQERSYNRNGDDRSQNDKYKNKSHEKYKHHSRDKSRDRSYQSHKIKSSDHSKVRGESERYDSHKKASTKEAVDQHVSEFSSPKNGGQYRSDSESLTKKDSSVESQECKELDLSEFDILSETDENMSDESDTKVKCCSSSRHSKSKTKKRHSNNEYENSTKKQAIESEYSEGSPKVNARKTDPLYGSSNNNSGAISDSTSPVLTEITDDRRNNVGERSEHKPREKEVDVTSKEESLSSLEIASLRFNICDSPEPTDTFAAENSYGPALPPQLIADTLTNVKSVKSATLIGPCLPENDARNATERFEGDAASSSNQSDLNQEDPDMIFGPVLPPHLLESKCSDKSDMKIIGPSLSNVTKHSEDDETEQANSDNEDAIGPLPADHPLLKSNFVYRQLEQRAQQIKTEQKIEDDSLLNQREEWMTELPPAQIGNLMGLAPRKFRVREGPDMSDRSCWTETPAKKAEKQRQQEQEKLYALTTNSSKESYETEVEKSKKREKSLMEIHQSKLKKKKKKEEKKAKLTGQTVRRPFDRDIDLKVNHFDPARKNTIISKAQYLDDRFSRGKI